MDRDEAVKLRDSYRSVYKGAVLDAAHLAVLNQFEILIKLFDIEKAIRDTELGQHAFRG